MLPFANIFTFTVDSTAFVLVSGDDRAIPLLAYSFNSPFGIKQMPSHVLAWIQDYDQQLEAIRVCEISQDESVAALWQRLESGLPLDALLPTAVSPMLTTTWDQYPYYNSQCPYDDDAGEYTLSGCVATATAQVMKFWNHPVTGRSSHSYVDPTYGTQSADFASTNYQWTQMPTALSASSTSEEVAAVAQLMYHIGVAVEMQYGTLGGNGSGSAAYGSMAYPSAQSALVTYFGYQPTIHYIRRQDYSGSEWIQTLSDELDAGHPILYSGADPTAGHAFVLDGYDANANFHINWGWGGYCDGYYTMGSLNPSSGGAGGNATYTFNMRNVAVVGIVPQLQTDATTTITVTPNNANYGSVSGSGTYYDFADISLYANANEGYRFTGWSDGSLENPRRMLASGGSYSLVANFDTIGTDTITYALGSYVSSLGTGGAEPLSWAIRIPSVALPSSGRLERVRLYVSTPGTYTLLVFSGTQSPTTLLHSQTATFTSSDSWQDVELSIVLTADNTQAMWVGFTTSDIAYPATYSSFSGNIDGLWLTTGDYNTDSQWSSYVTEGFDASWLIEAVFVSSSTPIPSSYTITAVPNNASWGAVSGSGTYYEGSTAILLATPNTHYRFDHWDDGVTANPRTVTVTDDATYTALFAAEEYTITVTANNDAYGSVSGGGNYAYGSQATLSATAATGYHFTRWNDFNIDNPRTVTVEGDADYTARFAVNNYTVTLLVNNQDFGYVEGAGNYTHGTTATLSATPYEGYHFVDWSDGNTNNPRSLTVTSDMELTANFEATNGIADASSYHITITTLPGVVEVGGAEGEKVMVTDLSGRVIYTSAHAADRFSFAVPAAGIYLLRVDDSVTLRIVAVQ